MSARTIENRGYYFDFLEFAKSGAKNQTPTTPAIPQIMALHYVCTQLLELSFVVVNRVQRRQPPAFFDHTVGIEADDFGADGAVDGVANLSE